MTDKFSVTSEGSIAWGNSGGQIPLDISELTINDSYATAVEDSADETHYFSMLDETTTGQNITLEDLHNISVNNARTEEGEGIANVEDSQDQQVVLFRVEGSDDLYGIQFANDGEGNLKKYQFQLRATEDGQLEAMPDTIQLLPEESDPGNENSEVDHLVKQEFTNTIIVGDTETDENDDTLLEENIYEEECETQETKTNTLEFEIEDMDEYHEDCQNDLLSVIVKNEQLEIQHENVVSLKEEHVLEELNYDNDGNHEQEELELSESIVINSQDSQENEVFQQVLEDSSEIVSNDDNIQQEMQHNEELANNEVNIQNEMTVLEYQNYSSNDNCEKNVVSYDSNVDDLDQESGNYANVYFEEREMDSELGGNIQFVENEIESDDTETYETVEGIHITADQELNFETRAYENSPAIFQQILATKSSEPLSTTNQRQKTVTNKTNPKKNNKTVLYYLMQNQEKENVNSVPLSTLCKAPMKTHPRSILRSDVELRLISDSKPLNVESNVQKEKIEPFNDKRFARSKKAVEEKLFNTFINRTTIPHAPVRQTRLPRKQKIKPVDNRRDAEIIVQEVMVSSNGFVEKADEGMKFRDRKYEVTTIELSDSEDERPKKLKRKPKKDKRTTSLSSENSDVIEIIQSDEENRIEISDKSAKDLNGISDDSINIDADTLKRANECSVNSLANCPKLGGSPNKKIRTVPSNLKSSNIKKMAELPNCSKSLVNKKKSFVRDSSISKIEYKHTCFKCGNTFKNNILLSRHNCVKSSNSKPECDVCLKTFNDNVMLNIHKKCHIKQNMMNKTNTVPMPLRKNVVPIKAVSSPSAKVNSKLSICKNNFKCGECQKVCSSEAILAIHAKSHKQFKCMTCRAIFTSNLLLENHLRLSCVKTASPKNRISTITPSSRRTMLAEPKKTMDQRPKSMNPMSKPMVAEVPCDLCSMKYPTLSALFKHKVKEHQLHTPNKKILLSAKPKLHKVSPAQCGIQPNERMRRIWAQMNTAVKKDELT